MSGAEKQPGETQTFRGVEGERCSHQIQKFWLQLAVMPSVGTS